MVKKEIVFSDRALDSLLKGVNIVAEAVGQTLGAKGRNVIIDKGIMSPLVTNDGVTIAKEVVVKDRLQQMGTSLVVEAAKETNDVAGDGTTTATVLTQAIVREGIKNIAAGANPMMMRRGIEHGMNEVIRKLREMSVKVKPSDIRSIATISSGDPDVGRAIADAVEKVGTDGVVTVEESLSIGLEVDTTEGMRFDTGLMYPHFMTDAIRLEAIHENAKILVTDRIISHTAQVVKVLNQLIESGNRELVIIAHHVEGEALASMVENQMKGNFKLMLITAPGYGERREEYLEDIATLTGATFVTEKLNMKLEMVTLDYLGSAGRVVSRKNQTTITGAGGKRALINARIEMLKTMIEEEKNPYDKDKLKDRLAKLSGGIGVIRIGAATESEMKDKKLRIEDALNAVRAALDPKDGGIVVGGGAALLHACRNVMQTDGDLTGDYLTGSQIVLKACEYPIWKIADNAGEKGDVIVETVAKGSETTGFDVVQGAYVNMFTENIIDPLKVTVTALTNACSAATMILTTGCIIVNEEDKA